MRRRLNRGLLVVYAVYTKEMKLWLRYPSWIFTFMALPYMISGLFYGIGYAIAGPGAVQNFAEKTGSSNPLLYYLLGSIIFMTATIVMDNMGASIRQEQLNGTFELHYLSPANKVLLWSSYVLPQGTIMLMTMIGSAIPPLVYASGGVQPVALIAGAALLFLGILPMFGIGLVVASLTVRYKEPWAITNMLRAVISVCSGFFYPLAVLPHWLRLVSQVIPTSYVVALLREALLFNRRIFLSDPRLMVLGIFSLLYPVLGLSFYARWEKNARKTGEISKY